MVLTFFGGLLLGSGAYVLLNNRGPLYPKPIAALFILVGIALAGYGIASPSLLF